MKLAPKSNQGKLERYLTKAVTWLDKAIERLGTSPKSSFDLWLSKLERDAYTAELSLETITRLFKKWIDTIVGRSIKIRIATNI